MFHNLTSVSMCIRSFHSHKRRKGNYHSLTNAHCVPGNMVRFLSVLFIYSSQSPRGTGRILQISKLNLRVPEWISQSQTSREKLTFKPKSSDSKPHCCTPLFIHGAINPTDALLSIYKSNCFICVCKFPMKNAPKMESLAQISDVGWSMCPMPQSQYLLISLFHLHGIIPGKNYVDTKCSILWSHQRAIIFPVKVYFSSFRYQNPEQDVKYLVHYHFFCSIWIRALPTVGDLSMTSVYFPSVVSFLPLGHNSNYPKQTPCWCLP